MQITVLNDNHAGYECTAEHGLSYLIDDEISVLFDAGPSDIILRNSKILGIDLQTVKYIVLSHGHWDHGNGLKYLSNTDLICHPGCFIKRYRKKNQSYIGLDMSFEDIIRNFNLKTTEIPYSITDRTTFLGEIPRKNKFESVFTSYVDENGNDDFTMDDSGLAIMTGNGLVIISGCAHSGICNMIEHAKSVTGISRIHAVIGGFHLRKINQQLYETIDFLKNQDIDLLMPSHCTSIPVIAEFYNHFSCIPVTTGSTYQF
jgi:7,8-dihydropterin-6-yl-methyl-4-(beta-D-ribofuranosyl)aminobenzene 5'-phosphate synthase